MGIQLARAACRNPNAGAARSALERIDTLLAAAEQLTVGSHEQASLAFGLVMTASAIAATEPIDQDVQLPSAANRRRANARPIART